MRRLFKAIMILVFYGMFAIAALELIYRYQVIDTYMPELMFNNPTLDLSKPSDQPTILVLGDSFSASPRHYPGRMGRILNNYRVINSGLGGTGIIEANIIAPRRFDQFEPAIFIYQIYIGNDLINISYPTNWSTISFLRNVYWTVAQRLRSIAFLNYRSGQLFASLKNGEVDTEAPPHNRIRDWKNSPDTENTLGDYENRKTRTVEEEFAPERYTLRDFIYFKAEPEILDHTILIQGKRHADYDVLLRKLERLLAYCKPEDCRALVLVVPHAAQVDRKYLSDMQQLGASFQDPGAIVTDEYPFLTGILEFLANKPMERVQVLSPVAKFREEEAAGRHVYFQNDSHLNDHGQQVLAKFIVDELALQ